MTVRIDLGGGHYLEPISASGNDNTVGYIEEHPRPDNGEPCRGFVHTYPTFDPDRPHWKVEQADPLTLSPSILCRTCGAHGFVRDGKWVPA